MMVTMDRSFVEGEASTSNTTMVEHKTHSRRVMWNIRDAMTRAGDGMEISVASP
ncbi:MAG: hypothetical protein JWM52_884 [Candidatus Saccharibacteria bacterium]|nr:hypothetical protein [Candidatus Saccharibacteria bacterium]